MNTINTNENNNVSEKQIVYVYAVMNVDRTGTLSIFFTGAASTPEKAKALISVLAEDYEIDLNKHTDESNYFVVIYKSEIDKIAEEWTSWDGELRKTLQSREV